MLQDPNDSPTDELLKCIAIDHAETDALAKAAKKASKKLSNINQPRTKTVNFKWDIQCH